MTTSGLIGSLTLAGGFIRDFDQRHQAETSARIVLGSAPTCKYAVLVQGLAEDARTHLRHSIDINVLELSDWMKIVHHQSSYW